MAFKVETRGAGPVAQAVKCARPTSVARGLQVWIPGSHQRTTCQAMLCRRPI